MPAIVWFDLDVYTYFEFLFACRYCLCLLSVDRPLFLFIFFFVPLVCCCLPGDVPCVLTGRAEKGKQVCWLVSCKHKHAALQKTFRVLNVNWGLPQFQMTLGDFHLSSMWLCDVYNQSLCVNIYRKWGKKIRKEKRTIEDWTARKNRGDNGWWIDFMECKAFSWCDIR